MKPYYEHAGIIIYHGDCLEILPQLPRVEALVTDPPYGINYGLSGGFSATHGWGPWRENVKWDEARPGKAVFDAMLALSVPSVIWGGNYFTDYLPPSMGWIAWDKGQRNFSLADFELAWTSEAKASRCIIYSRGRAVLDGRVHPTQKPVSVMKQCIEYLERGRSPLGSVLDPFAGSGTTLLAAKECGKQAIGIEIEEKYCEITAKRLSQEVFAF